MPPSLLLIAPESVTPPIADSLRHDLRAEVETTPSRRAALASLRRNEFDLILIDESLATTDSASTDLLYQSAGGAIIVELNLALSSAPRVVRQAHAALGRRAQDLARTQTAVLATLQSELNATLSSVLLESQLALREATPEQAPRLRHLVQLAGKLRDRLRV